MSRQTVLSTNYQLFSPSSFHDPNVASISRLSYRPALQLPPRAPELPTYSTQNTNHRAPANINMASMQDQEEYARLQELSNKYQPEFTGPLVSDRQPSSAITSEFADADPVYQVKTASLSQKYSHFRTCRRDGHCGWRAVAFCYFEAMLRLGDQKKFLEEEARLRSLSNLLNTVGFESYLYEDFAEDTFDLLRKTSASITSRDTEATLLANFNDENFTMSIITYLKLLTSAWIQTHAAEFEPFLLGQDIRQYCSMNIEPAVCEIEHIGMKALVDVLVKPARFAVEILYLDRSPGEEVNMHRFDPDSNGGVTVVDPPTLRLLYRPGHYDILYKMEDLQPPVLSSPPMTSHVTVNIANHTDQYRALDIDSSNVLAWIPGMSVVPQSVAPHHAFLPQQYDFSPTSMSQPPPQHQPQSPMEQMHTFDHVPVSPTSRDFVGSAIPSEPTPVSMPLNSPISTQNGGPFRPSVWEFEPEVASGLSHNTFQTSIFKNSHFNTAHYLNPDFQPEEWTPDAEYTSSGRTRKSTSQ